MYRDWINSKVLCTAQGTIFNIGNYIPVINHNGEQYGKEGVCVCVCVCVYTVTLLSHFAVQQ